MNKVYGPKIIKQDSITTGIKYSRNIPIGTYYHLGHKITATLPIVIGEQELVLKGWVEIGLRPSTIPRTIKLNVVDF